MAEFLKKSWLLAHCRKVLDPATNTNGSLSFSKGFTTQYAHLGQVPSFSFLLLHVQLEPVQLNAFLIIVQRNAAKY